MEGASANPGVVPTRPTPGRAPSSHLVEEDEDGQGGQRRRGEHGQQLHAGRGHLRGVGSIDHELRAQRGERRWESPGREIRQPGLKPGASSPPGAGAGPAPAMGVPPPPPGRSVPGAVAVADGSRGRRSPGQRCTRRSSWARWGPCSRPAPAASPAAAAAGRSGWCPPAGTGGSAAAHGAPAAPELPAGSRPRAALPTVGSVAGGAPSSAGPSSVLSCAAG